MKQPVFPNEIKRPSVPTRFKGEARKCWRKIVNAHPPDFFRAGDLPLLESYCLLYSQMRECEAALANGEPLVITDVNGMVRPNPWQKILMDLNTKMNATATKLRLCPNARHSGNVAGNANPKKTMQNTQSTGNVRRMFGS